MKVIIAYDGSVYADAAIADLPRAGLPMDAEVLVASVADFSAGRPAASEFDLLSAASRRMDAVIEQARYHDAHVMEETRALVSNAVSGIQDRFPEWTVRNEVLTGDPVEEFLLLAKEWNADLMIGGSHGRSAIGRFFYGSVSKSVAEQATCSVRVVKSGFEKPDSEPAEVMLGVKNPAEAERLVDRLTQRVWPADTRMRLVVVDEVAAAGRVAAYCPEGKSIYENAAEVMAAAGPKVSVQIESGEAKTIFLEAADVWRADVIFIDAGVPTDQGLDDTAVNLVTDARCTVEVVR